MYLIPHYKTNLLDPTFFTTCYKNWTSNKTYVKITRNNSWYVEFRIRSNLIWMSTVFDCVVMRALLNPLNVNKAKIVLLYTNEQWDLKTDYKYLHHHHHRCHSCSRSLSLFQDWDVLTQIFLILSMFVSPSLRHPGFSLSFSRLLPLLASSLFQNINNQNTRLIVLKNYFSLFSIPFMDPFVLNFPEFFYMFFSKILNEYRKIEMLEVRKRPLRRRQV